MNTNKLFLLLAFNLWLSMVVAQVPSSCGIDYQPIQQLLKPAPFLLETGHELVLSNQYLADIRAGVFDQEPSGMSHFVYLRPGSKQELKTAKVNHQLERINQNGDVFGLKTTPGSNHFFRPDENFDGDFRPQWKDPIMVIPLGLNPIDITTYADHKFKIKESRYNYILLEVEGDYLVFYPGYPETYEVFNSPDIQVQLAERQTWGESLVGRRLMVKNSPNLRYRLSQHGKNLYLPNSRGEMEIFVNAVFVDRKQLLLEYGMDEPLYLVIDAHSDFDLKDAQCVYQEQKEIFARRQADENMLNKRIDEVMASADPTKALLQDEWLQQKLSERFHLNASRSNQQVFFDYLSSASEVQDLAPALKVMISEEGQLVLRSIFVSNNGLYHTKVELRLDGDTYISERVSTLDSRSRRRRVQGKIIESIEYLPSLDHGIIEAVALNHNAPIVIRFVAGGSFYEEVELSEASKIAIRDAWLFSQLIKSQPSGQLEASMRSGG